MVAGGHVGCRWACVVDGGHAWLLGGVHGCRGCVWLLVGHVCLLGGHAWLLGACMVARGCVVAGGMHSYWGAYMAKGGMHGEGGVHGKRAGA